MHENGAPRMLPGTNAPDVRIFIVPVKNAQLLGNWDVIGLRATGSVDYALTDVFVPEPFTHKQSANEARQGGSFYRLGISGIGAICHTGFRARRRTALPRRTRASARAPTAAGRS